jgi:glutamate/tyrosine decarboxylase-like PLP-dependent enzyme
MKFPETGRPSHDVLDDLRAMRQGDAGWAEGRVPLFVFKGTDQASAIAQDAFNIFFAENALGKNRAFPSLKRMEDEIIEMALDLFNAPAGATGFVSTGGSESIIQAVQTARDWSRAKRADPTHRGNIVMAYSAHPAFDKAARLMDLEVRRIDTGPDYQADVEAMVAALDGDTIMMVGSAPCFPYGVFDDIEGLGAAAAAGDVWLHVDACVGGYLAPFAKSAGFNIPPFDLAVPGVTSLSADLHKFGWAPKPISTIFYARDEHARHHGFDFDGWPNGRFQTNTIVGTRAGGAIAGSWALFQHLGRDGYARIAKDLLDGIQRYRDGIASIEGLGVVGDPLLSIVAVEATDKTVDIFAVADALQEKGWVAGLVRRPKALHRMMSMLHVPVVDDYLSDLEAAVEVVRASGKGSGLTATY